MENTKIDLNDLKEFYEYYLDETFSEEFGFEGVECPECKEITFNYDEAVFIQGRKMCRDCFDFYWEKENSQFSNNLLRS